MTEQYPWVKNPKVTLQTSLGPVEATFFADRVFIRTNAHINDDKPAITWREGEFLVSFNLWKFLGWRPKPDREEHFSLSERKAPTQRNRPLLQQAIVDACRNAMLDYAERNPDVFRQGAEAVIRRNMSEQAEEIRKAKEAYEKALEGMQSLKRELQDLSD